MDVPTADESGAGKFVKSAPEISGKFPVSFVASKFAPVVAVAPATIKAFMQSPLI